MMRFPGLVAALLLSAFPLMGQVQESDSDIDEIYLDARAIFHQEVRGGQYGTHFQGDHFNLNVRGHISPSVSFRVRQRLNKEIDIQNPFKATDFLWVKWQASQKWSFSFGKQAILVGGYEFDAVPIDVYYYSAFCTNLPQCYAFGASAHYSPAEDQVLTLQFVPSPVSPGLQNVYSYNLHWAGKIAPWWQTLWSVNLIEDEYHRMLNYIALGNRFPLGALVLDLDLMNRASFRQPRFLSDWTVITKAIWTIGNWNLCTKVGYEYNDAANVDDLGRSYDTCLPAGNDYFYGGAGVEWFPLGNERLRLHAVWFRDNHDHVDNFDVGITWRMNLWRR